MFHLEELLGWCVTITPQKGCQGVVPYLHHLCDKTSPVLLISLRAAGFDPLSRHVANSDTSCKPASSFHLLFQKDWKISNVNFSLTWITWVSLLQVGEVTLITVDFPCAIKALAESTNPPVLQGARDLSERVANQISVCLNGDTVITADMIQSYKLLPFKKDLK